MSIRSLHHSFTKMADDFERWTEQDARNAGIDVSREDFAGFRNQWARGDSVPRSVVENLAGEKALHTKGLRSMGQRTGAFFGGAGEGISENVRGLGNMSLRAGGGASSGIHNLGSRTSGTFDRIGHFGRNLWRGTDDVRTEQFRDRVQQRQRQRAKTHDRWHAAASQSMSDDSIFNKNFDTATMDAGHSSARRAQHAYRARDREERRGQMMADWDKLNQNRMQVAGMNDSFFDHIGNAFQRMTGNNPNQQRLQNFGNQMDSFQTNWGQNPAEAWGHARQHGGQMPPGFFDFNNLPPV